MAKNMFVNVKLLTIVPSINTYTAYFFHKRTCMVLPIVVPEHSIQMILRDNNGRSPTLQNTVFRIIRLLNADITSISIYLYRDTTYYTYLHIKAGDRILEINCSFEDGLILCLHLNRPIYIDERIISKNGFKITKELIERSLISA